MLLFYSTMVATVDKKATADKKAPAEKKVVKGKEDSKKLPAVPESVLKHRKRRDALRTRRIQVNCCDYYRLLVMGILQFLH